MTSVAVNVQLPTLYNLGHEFFDKQDGISIADHGLVCDGKVDEPN